MGWFKNSFGIGAGVTLGDMAAQTGVTMVVDIIDGSTKKLQDDYRIEHFDPIVRDDISHIIARSALSEMSYPFPTELDSNAKAAQQPGERNGFVKRHKIAVGITAALVLVAICNPKQSAIVLLIGLWLLIVAVGITIFKKASRTASGMMVGALSAPKQQLIKDGQQYWRIREYVRQALAASELSPQDAVLKLSRTQLGQQFPDTVEEIEANAFYYKQKLQQ